MGPAGQKPIPLAVTAALVVLVCGSGCGDDAEATPQASGTTSPRAQTTDPQGPSSNPATQEQSVSPPASETATASLREATATGQQAVPVDPNERFEIVQQRPVRKGLRRRLTMTVGYKRESRISLGETPLNHQSNELTLLLQGIETVLQVDEKKQPLEVEIEIEQCLWSEGAQAEEVLLVPGSVLRVVGGEETHITLAGGELPEKARELLSGALSLSGQEEPPPLAREPKPLGVSWEVDAPEYLASFNKDPRVELAPDAFSTHARIDRIVEGTAGREMELRLRFRGRDVRYTEMPDNFVPHSSIVSGRITMLLPLEASLPETRREVRFRLKLIGTIQLEGGLEAGLLTTFQSTSTRSYGPVG